MKTKAGCAATDEAAESHAEGAGGFADKSAANSGRHRRRFSGSSSEETSSRRWLSAVVENGEELEVEIEQPGGS